MTFFRPTKVSFFSFFFLLFHVVVELAKTNRGIVVAATNQPQNKQPLRSKTRSATSSAPWMMMR